MPLWTDLMDPVEATGIARAEMDAIERAQNGTLAHYLPNVFVPSTYVEFVAGANGLTDVAHYRAFSSPPKIGSGPKGERKTITLPAISRNEPISEQEQMSWESLTEDQQLKSIEKAIRRNVRAISDRQELTRGIAIETGKAYWEDVVADGGPVDYILNDDFKRDPALDITAAALWSVAGTDALAQLETWAQLYASHNGGVRPGAVRMSRRAFNAMRAASPQFQIAFAGGGSALMPADEVSARVVAEGLPAIDIYDRQVMVNGVQRNVLDPVKIQLLPAATDPNDEDGTLLGATFWGRTRSSTFPSWGIEPDEQPGIVCGVFSEDSVGSAIEVQGDSIGEPVLRNANATMTIKVL